MTMRGVGRERRRPRDEEESVSDAESLDRDDDEFLNRYFGEPRPVFPAAFLNIGVQAFARVLTQGMQTILDGAKQEIRQNGSDSLWQLIKYLTYPLPFASKEHFVGGATRALENTPEAVLALLKDRDILNSARRQMTVRNLRLLINQNVEAKVHRLQDLGRNFPQLIPLLLNNGDAWKRSFLDNIVSIFELLQVIASLPEMKAVMTAIQMPEIVEAIQQDATAKRNLGEYLRLIRNAVKEYYNSDMQALDQMQIKYEPEDLVRYFMAFEKLVLVISAQVKLEDLTKLKPFNDFVENVLSDFKDTISFQKFLTSNKVRQSWTKLKESSSYALLMHFSAKTAQTLQEMENEVMTAGAVVKQERVEAPAAAAGLTIAYDRSRSVKKEDAEKVDAAPEAHVAQRNTRRRMV